MINHLQYGRPVGQREDGRGGQLCRLLRRLRQWLRRGWRGRRGVADGGGGRGGLQGGGVGQVEVGVEVLGDVARELVLKNKTKI